MTISCMIKDIPFHSHSCEHSTMVPNHRQGRMSAICRTGVLSASSKIARVVDIFAHRLQTQEADDGADCRHDPGGAEPPRGVAVMIEAEHMCNGHARHPQAGLHHADLTPFTGAFRDTPEEQVRFMMMVRG